MSKKTSEPSASTVPSLLTTNEVAEMLRLSPLIVFKWRSKKHNGLPYIRVGRFIRYFRNDIETWLEAHKVVPEVAPSQSST